MVSFFLEKRALELLEVDFSFSNESLDQINRKLCGLVRSFYILNNDNIPLRHNLLHETSSRSYVLIRFYFFWIEVESLFLGEKKLFSMGFSVSFTFFTGSMENVVFVEFSVVLASFFLEVLNLSQILKLTNVTLFNKVRKFVSLSFK